MKEYISQLGGRYTYIDDIANLQDLALSITSMFNDCGNFIINGCEIQGNTLTPGYVFMNKKIRYCEGLSVIKKTDATFVYICEKNSYENVAYEEAGDKVGRIVHGCYASESLPSGSDIDPVTNQQPQFITIYKGSAAYMTQRLFNAFFGRYAVLANNPNKDGQSVKNDLSITGQVQATKPIISESSLQVLRNGGEAYISVDEYGSVIFKNITANGGKYDIRIKKSGVVEFWNGGVKIAEISEDGSVFKSFLQSDLITTGSASMSDNSIYNSYDASDAGSLNINLAGYHGKHEYFRTTNIGDGHGNIVLSVRGKNHSVNIEGVIAIRTQTDIPLDFYARHGSHDPALVNYISWKDNGNAQIMKLGYTSSKDNSFYISNAIGSVTITSDCNINGTLKLKGRDVTEQFVDAAQYKKDMQKKANATDVYSKTDADNTFLKLSGEFTALVNHIGGDANAAKAKLRGQIDAVYTGDMVKYPLHQHKLLDMVMYGLPSEPQENPEHESVRQQQILRNRQEICANIGAVLYTNPMATVSADTKIQLDGSAFDTSKSELYIRRCGRIILIQGTLVPIRGMNQFHAFTLPPEFPAPNHRITQRLYYREHRMSCSLGGQFGAHFTIDNDNQSTMYVSMMYIFS